MKSPILIVFSALLTLLSTGVSFAQSALECASDPAAIDPYALRADEINREIQRAGLSWSASDNEVARLHFGFGWYPLGPLQSIAFPEEFEPFVADRKEALPEHFNWRNVDGKNYVTGPKNQLSCGSCWAFATTGPIEGAMAIAEDWVDPQINLSEQQLLSCSTAGSCESGGLTTASFRFAQQTGLTLESCFPYKGRMEDCDTICEDWHNLLYKIDSWKIVSVTGFSIEDLKAAIYKAPIAASLVIYEDFMYYQSGVYDPTVHVPLGLHAVTLIGWDNATQAWIGKNSWGTSWGDGGFFMIKWGAALIGSMSILPTYTAQGIPDPGSGDDDDDDTDDDDMDDDAQDDDGGDDEQADDDDAQPETSSGSDDDDDDSGGCGG